MAAGANRLVELAIELAQDAVLLDPTDDQLVHAVAEMCGRDYCSIGGDMRARIIEAYDGVTEPPAR